MSNDPQQVYQASIANSSGGGPTIQQLPSARTGIVLYMCHCIASMLFMGAYVVFGVVMFSFSEQLAKEDRDINDPVFFQILGGVFAAIFIFPTLLYLIGLFTPRNKFGYYYGMVVICVGFIFGCQPLAIAAIIFWIRPETKAHFGIPIPPPFYPATPPSHPVA